jgi:hypothetical protein
VNAISKIITFRFVVAALLASVGCYALLVRWFDPALFFCFLPIVTMSRSDMLRPIPDREVLILIGAVFIFAILSLVCEWLIPFSVGSVFERIIRHSHLLFHFGYFCCGVFIVSIKDRKLDLMPEWSQTSLARLVPLSRF